jgi:hypothetical protein
VAFALMPVIATTLFEFSLRETAAMSAVRTGAWPGGDGCARPERIPALGVFS